MDTQEIENFAYLMDDMTVLPDITFLKLNVLAYGHAFGASAFHVLRMCSGIRRLKLFLAPTHSEVQLSFLLPPFQIIGCFGKSRYIFFYMHLDKRYV